MTVIIVIGVACIVAAAVMGAAVLAYLWGGMKTEKIKIELLALRIRNLIAAREFNTATANRELQCGDGWLCDHGQYDRELSNEIDELLKKAIND